MLPKAYKKFTYNRYSVSLRVNIFHNHKTFIKLKKLTLYNKKIYYNFVNYTSIRLK